MDGYEATRAIRAHEGQGAHTPIVGLTANAMSGDRERCLAVGMDEYLAKPVELAALRRTLERFVDRSAAVVAPAIDVARLATITELVGVAETRGLIVSFASSSRGHIRALLEGIGARDFPRVATSAHALKGSALTAGAARLAASAAALEAAAVDARHEECARLVAALEGELDLALAGFERSLSDTG
jgi:HPt (histidine-containing phosphotransfer) domain-containing protein